MQWKSNATSGRVIASRNHRGDDLTQLTYPNGIAVDHFSHIYISNEYNDRMVCWIKDAKEGSLVVGGNRQGNESNQLAFPKDLSIDQEGNLYVVDSYNHRVQKFLLDSN